MGSNIAVINTAKNYIGKLSYAFGGSNIQNGYGDCSIFTQFCYAQAGVNIGRTTEQQYRNTYHVIFADAQAGDLIFFKDTWDSPSGHIDGVEHVGIYVGNGDFIHLNDNGCKVNNINEKYWNEHYLTTGRVDGLDYLNYNESMSAFDRINSVSVSNNSTILNQVFRVVMVVTIIIFGVIFFASAIGVQVKLTDVKGGENNGTAV